MTVTGTGVEELAQRLAAIVGENHVLPPAAAYLSDATEARGLRGRADLVVLPRTAGLTQAPVIGSSAPRCLPLALKTSTSPCSASQV